MCNVTGNEVILFLSEFTAVCAQDIQPKTDVARDLGVDGDDAIDLLDQFSERFDVDLSNLNGSKYFGPEKGWNPILYLFDLITGKIEKEKKEPLYVQYLIEAADQKAWPEHLGN